MLKFRRIGSVSVVYILIAILGLACSTVRHQNGQRTSSYQQLSKEDKSLADSLVLHALDNEALYTVTGHLKPMSSVADIYVKVPRDSASDNTLYDEKTVEPASIEKLARYQRVVNALQFGDLHFVMSPYRIYTKDRRAMSVNVYRESLVDSMIRANKDFYAQLGFVPGCNPAALISTTENSGLAARYRSYGYLYGYPEHAVRFFVEASMNYHQKGEKTGRQFFNIPVYAGEKGRFVYAISKDTEPSAADSAIYKRAVKSLERYRKLRGQYVRKDKTADVIGLLNALQKEND
ncbi:hypothetical protein [Pararcticibacter amylolyticus]|uniref:Lipoprotein n=1 Tax=Pararcticibacter amylolyticus TaxID=2173175 RepID=A0A2U2PJK2_9SPHI|nr:hypothetical protein [Pararcticibacter amylolyticus]PWG81586.1 hypothetical protein DDR33_07075 [Pararcticibacter amylolyticus]